MCAEIYPNEHRNKMFSSASLADYIVRAHKLILTQCDKYNVNLYSSSDMVEKCRTNAPNQHAHTQTHINIELKLNRFSFSSPQETAKSFVCDDSV